MARDSSGPAWRKVADIAGDAEPALAHPVDAPKVGVMGRKQYHQALHLMDAATCEALAVGQAQAGRMAAPHIGYATHVFARMCASASSLMHAAPLTRWCRTDFEDWNFSGVAGHARSLADGYLLFHYFLAEPESEAEMKARINILYMNDCSRRIELLRNAGVDESEIEGLEVQAAEIKQRLLGNAFFTGLAAGVQKQCLNGKFLMTATRDEMLERVGIPKGQFDAYYDLWSQHIHILPLSFFRMEPNGRGTGLENDADRSYIGAAMAMCAAMLSSATDSIVEMFPDVGDRRRGVKSEFSPGPHANRPRPNRGKGMKQPAAPAAAAAPLSDEILEFVQSMGARLPKKA